ncbi:LPXTG-site transpeptidase (sortase) family protein [Prauserella shujinwangii]|uniref:LPXTG-site transpeptidase (Sortase) family protein n=1 Tax=Prauserella shujinwangii TaxID=1453103 RepID=A0A2T0LVB3_9PSEU|nr:class E sortase [Prauserella shujinwangii]PRX47782.1 LPXTG-site transpeptidase (sortase) family protein [Prauserella shujinwangii]
MSRYEEPETREIPVPGLARRPDGRQGRPTGQPPRRTERREAAPPRRPAGPPRHHPRQEPRQSREEETRPIRVPPPEPPEDPPAAPPENPESPRSGGGRGRIVVRTVGELLITMGLVVLLFVVYELYVTNLMSAQLQREASADLDERWSQERELRAEPLEGEAFARIYIPSFGADWGFTIQEGTDGPTLEIGPGHYVDTAMPGEPGNFGVAGHRVGKGAPFNDLDLLNSCDAIVVETARSFFVYRVLPMKDEVANWAQRKASDPACANVAPLQDEQGAYDQTFGRVIVLPQRGDAVAPVPYQPSNVLPPASQASLMTLTTCHPQFSDRQRLIIHSVLTNEYQKQPGTGYDDLLREIGEA